MEVRGKSVAELDSASTLSGSELIPIVQDGVGKKTTVGAINKINTGTCTSSYGTVSYTRSGNVVQLNIACTGIATNTWTSICTDIPKAKTNFNTSGLDQSSGSDVSLSITGSTLQFYGRGSVSTCLCAIVYIAE